MTCHDLSRGFAKKDRCFLTLTVFLILSLPLASTGWAQGAKAPAKAATKGKTAPATTLPFPPSLPGTNAIVTDTSPDFLVPSANLKPGILVAKAAPVVDFLFFPGQDHPGRPWSVWGDGCVSSGKYYTAIGDHLSPRGTAQVYEYDPEARKACLLVDVRKFLESSGTLPPDMNYTPGKVHSRIQMGSDGWLYYSTHRGSGGTTTDEYGYLGDWILRTHPGSGETEIVAAQPVPKHCIPASTLDPQRLIFYGGTASGKNAPVQKIQFLAYDIKNRKVLKSGDNGFARYAIFSSSTGKIFWRPGGAASPDLPADKGLVYDPASNETGPCNAPDVRSATTETRDGWVYGTTERSADVWGYNVRSDRLETLGSGQVCTATYVTSMEVDPSGRYLYFVPGAHGGGARDGAPVVQFDVKTRKAKVLAFLYDFYHKTYGYSLDGTFSTALSEDGATLYITWNGYRAPATKWESCAMTAIHIPESERQP
jgi:hypothetical protein